MITTSTNNSITTSASSTSIISSSDNAIYDTSLQPQQQQQQAQQQQYPTAAVSSGGGVPNRSSNLVLPFDSGGSFILASDTSGGNSSSHLLLLQGGGNGSGSFSNKKPPMIPKRQQQQQQQQQQQHQQSSLEEAAASLAASMGLVLEDVFQYSAAHHTGNLPTSTNCTTLLLQQQQQQQGGSNSSIILTDEETPKMTSSSTNPDDSIPYNSSSNNTNSKYAINTNTASPNIPFVKIEFARPLFFGAEIPYTIQRELDQITMEQEAGNQRSDSNGTPNYYNTSLQATRNTIHFFTKQLNQSLYIYSPNWDNSWDKQYSHQKCWEYITKAQIAATSISTTTTATMEATTTTPTAATATTPVHTPAEYCGSNANTPTTSSPHHHHYCSSSTSWLDVTAHTPIYGCDDPSLPTVADLGQFDTNQEQMANHQQREVQLQIDTVFPEIYRITGTACPNPSTYPDDSTSWNNHRAAAATATANASTTLLFSTNSNITTTSTPTTPTGISTATDTNAVANTTTKNTQQSLIDPSSTSTIFATKNQQLPRIGWWNPKIFLQEESKLPFPILLTNASNPSHSINITPDFLHHPPPPLPPSIAQLTSHNLPLSLLHSSTGTSFSLPFLADRPPSWRYLQIDTQTIHWNISHPTSTVTNTNSIQQQIEPYFCTMAIYHVEPILSEQQQDAPKWRCFLPKSGRVTEALRFDIVNHEDTMDLHQAFPKSLWPYHVSSLNNMTAINTQDGDYHQDRLQATRVGIFPLPSNLEISNLYAVLVVHKVLSEDNDCYDFNTYNTNTSSSARMPQSSQQQNHNAHPSSHNKIITKHRTRAQKAADKLGLFLTPFAFGVAPLVKAIGEEVPTIVPTSRAVQIPLMKLEAGRGEIPILDHIIQLQYPRSDDSGSGTTPEAALIGGTALLVMRNFGYLGLSSAIDTRSTLAKQCVVDFTCERQIRRRRDEEESQSNSEKEDDGETSDDKWNTMQAWLPPWYEKSVAGPTRKGGRCKVVLEQEGKLQASQSPFTYAQELAPIPISMTTPYLNPSQASSVNFLRTLGGGIPKASQVQQQQQHHRVNSTESSTSLSSSKAPASGTNNTTAISISSSFPQHQPSLDAEPMWHTSICNELLIHPRFIDNCSKSKQNLCVSIELRKLAVLDDGYTVLALPLSRPHIHNPRRGPWLVHTAFSSGAYHVANPHFIDEFKVKLPAVLEAGHVLYCSVYNLSVKGKKTLSAMLTGYASKNLLGNKDSRPTHVGTKQSLDSVPFDEPDQFMVPNKEQFSPEEEDMNHGLFQASIQSWVASPHVDLIGSGFLPLAHLKSLRSDNSDNLDQSICLIANGLHDISISCIPKPLDQSSLLSDSQLTKSSAALLFGGSKRASDNSGLFGYSKNADKQNHSYPVLPSSIAAENLPKFSLEDTKLLPEGTVILRSKSSTSSQPSASDGVGNTSLDNYSDVSPHGSFDHEDGSETNSRSFTKSFHSQPPHSPKTVNHQLQKSHSRSQIGVPNQAGEHRDGMILQMRSISLSTLHNQNSFLAHLAGQATSPKLLTEFEKSQIKENGIDSKGSEFLFEGAAVLTAGDEEESSPEIAALISLLSDLTKLSLCPCIEHVLQFFRVTSLLLSYTISGPSGKYDASYCDPNYFTPLRLHSFSTLLNIWWQIVLFLQKCGVKQLDGRRKWNIYMIAKIVGLVWSENVEDVGTLEEYSPEMEEDSIPPTAKTLQVESQSQVEMLPVVQEESASFSQAEANSSVTSDVPDNEGCISTGADANEIFELPPLTRKDVKKSKLSRQVTPFPTDSISQTNAIIDDSLFRKLLGGDESTDNLDQPVIKPKSDSLVLEPIIKSDSNLPKRKTRHNRSVTPMGNITDMLRHAKETQSLDRNLFRYISADSKSNIGDIQSNLLIEPSTSALSEDLIGSSSTDMTLFPNTFHESSKSEPCDLSLKKPLASSSEDSAAISLMRPLDSSTVRPPTPKPHVDSKYDFQNLLKQVNMNPLSNDDGCRDDFDDLLAQKSNNSTTPLGMGRRKWMTLPNISMLATIEEDIEGEDCKSPQVGVFMRKTLDTEISDELLKPSVPTKLGMEISPANADVGEIHFAPRVPSKQFRIPRKSGMEVTGKESSRSAGLQDPSAYGMNLGVESGGNSHSTVASGISLSSVDSGKIKQNNSGGQRRRPNSSSNSRPVTDDEIESAGTAFLDMIGKNLGLGVAAKDMGGEERPVGQNHHRKTQSRCSIDWTLPPPDMMFDRQGMDLHSPGNLLLDEEGSESSSSDFDADTQNSLSLEASAHPKFEASSNSIFIQPVALPHPLLVEEAVDVFLQLSPTQINRVGPPSLSTEDGGGLSKNNDGNSSVATNSFFKNAALAASFPLEKLLKLPGFAERHTSSTGLRWWPFAYEVILYTWVTLLMEQTKNNDASGGATPITSGARKRTGARNLHALSVSSPESNSSTVVDLPQPVVTTTSKQLQKYLSEKASKAKGVTISCAPILFEVIKKSLAERIHNLLKQRQQRETPSLSPTHASLDPSLLSTLETLVQLITDACIDSRNFDSNSFRQTSSDVNDALVMFLRDLYSLIHPAHVHRLLFVYFSRYILKEGKHWSNRDSKIGLRCAWETCKFRLNAVTLLVRFPDFTKVNSPIISQIDSGRHHSRRFYSHCLEYIEKELCIMSPFAAMESQPSMRKKPSNSIAPNQGAVNSGFSIPPYQPHCLAELLTDICLAASGHTEQSIQHRASSLLSELFWMHQLEGKASGTLPAIGGMYVTLIPKLLDHLDHLACLSAKCQLRKDLLPTAVFVMQTAPSGLLNALWRKLIRRAVGRVSSTSNKVDSGGVVYRARSNSMDSQHLAPPPIDASSLSGSSWDKTEVTMDEDDKPCIFDVFCLLNLALKTFEYDGAEMEEESIDQLSSWQNDFVQVEENCSTAASRKWHAHDGSVVIINTTRCIVHEILYLLRSNSSEDGGFFSSYSLTPLHLSDVLPSVSFSGSKRNNEKLQRKKRRHIKYGSSSDASFFVKPSLNFSVNDAVLLVRAASSVYLHALSLRVSDSVRVKTLTGAIELLKIFGVKLFLMAVGETLQHWMRLVLFCGGARRANVRIQALDFLALLLRVTWASHGSLSRIRIPIIATLTEVMEKIVDTAAKAHYREQRKQGKLVEYLSNDAAEASLCPLWRTLDRLHHQSASQNAAFKDSLARLAEMMKKLFRAYIAAHSLAVADRMKASLPSKVNRNVSIDEPIRSDKLNRLTALSAGFSRQFIGILSTSTSRQIITNDEAVEEVFLAAANVFSPIELPSHRVAWLRRLSEFHKSRGKFAEEASCHLCIHASLQQAARVHPCLWFSVPFLPWTTETSDGINLSGEGAVGGSVQLGGDNDDLEDSIKEYDSMRGELCGIHHADKTSSFRRLFHRSASSLQFGRGDWETYGNRRSFFGVSNSYEYENVQTVTTLRLLEEEMIEEAEIAGDLFLTAGIIQRSRLSWSVATQFYAENFNFARLAYCYQRLSTVVASQIPVVDTNSAHELSSPLGRFYKVYFHGSAPDELVGKEFVYRTSTDDTLEAFGKRISKILESVLHEGTPIDLYLDDGRPEESGRKRPSQRVRVAPIRSQNREIGPCQIKITPLRPVLQGERQMKGSAEWFLKKSEIARSSNAQIFTETRSITSSRIAGNVEEGSRHTIQSPHHRAGKRYTNDSDRLGSMPSSFSGYSNDQQLNVVVADLGYSNLLGNRIEMTAGVDMFTFTRPVRKDKRGSREWYKNVGDLAEKSLRVSQFHVDNCFPCCVSRQSVVDRTKLVYYQSPLEAGIEAVCSWCSVLFRTIVSINGQAVLAGKPLDHIGPSAEKVLADCIFLCKVKELGVALLSTNTGYAAEFDDEEVAQPMMGGRHGRLSEEEVVKCQHTLARSIAIYLELLHLLIARNRDLLLVVVKARKREERQQKLSSSGSVSYPSSPGSVTRATRQFLRKHDSGADFSSQSAAQTEHYYNADDDDHVDVASIGSGYKLNRNGNEKIDAAIAVQSELQRAFISQAKILYPIISNVLYSETPRWLKACTQDGYFSSGAYRQTRLSMEQDIFFYDLPLEGRSTAGLETVACDAASVSWENPPAPMYETPVRSYSPNGSYSGAGSVASKTSDTSRRRRGLKSPAHSTASSKHFI